MSSLKAEQISLKIYIHVAILAMKRDVNVTWFSTPTSLPSSQTTNFLPAMSLRIRLLGTLLIEDEQGTPSEIMKWSKGCALLAFLIITDQVQSREAVADLLWEASSTSQSLQNLRKLLSRMRKWAPALNMTRKQVAYAASSTDYHTLIAGLASADIQALDEALQLFEGELLGAFYLDDAPRFNEWLLIERERLRQQVVAAYHRLCMVYAEQALWPQGIAAAQRWLQLDELDEQALRHLLKLLAASGQVEVALRQYETSRTRLWEELGVEPEPETLHLGQRLSGLKSETGGGLAWDAVVQAQPERPQPGYLAEPGPLPAQAYLAHRRNDDFIGRQELLIKVAELLLPQSDVEPQQQVAALTGIGGVGKTQAAVEFAYRYGRFFPGGVFWLNFADPDNVPAEVAEIGGELGMALYRGAEQLTLADQVGRVRRAWQELMPRLLIFDNCEHEALLADWLPVTGGCRVLLTSRRAQWSRELRVVTCPLYELEPDEGAALLQRLVPHLARNDAGEIAAEVGHLPLALHLAGGFLRRYRQVSPARYLAELRDTGLLRHPSLRGRGLRYSPTAHELDVSRTFAISLTRLDPADEVDKMAVGLLAHAACFAPGEPIPRPLLQATIGESGTDDDDIMDLLLAEDGLARLITLGFVEDNAGGRVVMHRLVAAFAAEFLDVDRSAQDAVEETLWQALSTYWEEEGQLNKLPFSVAHLQHVSDRTLLQADGGAFRLATLLGAHFREIGDYKNARKYLRKAGAAAKKMKDVNGQAEAQIWLAKAHEDIKETLAQVELAEQLLRAYEGADLAIMAAVLHYKGWALFQMGRAEAALATAGEGLEISAAANSRQLIGDLLNLMGTISYYTLGRHEAAIRYLEQALDTFRSLGNRHAESTVLNNMAESARLRGDYGAARDLYIEAIDVIRETGNLKFERFIRSNLYGALVGLGEYDVAASELEALIPEATVNWRILSEVNRFLAEARLGQGKTEAALEAARQALALGTGTKVFYDVGRAWRVLGQIAAHLQEPVRVGGDDGDLYDAAACFAKSIELFTDTDVPRDRALTMWQWAEYEYSVGNTAQAQELCRSAREIFQRLNLPLMLARMDESPNLSRLGKASA